MKAAAKAAEVDRGGLTWLSELQVEDIRLERTRAVRGTRRKTSEQLRAVLEAANGGGLKVDGGFRRGAFQA
jgi:hypothetical protein